MNAGQFAKRRARLEQETGRRKGYAGKALKALIREAGAVTIVRTGKAVAWRMRSGQVVCRKRRYDSEEQAQDALEAVQRDPRTPKIPGRLYSCPFCHGYHLTSQPKY